MLICCAPCTAGSAHCRHIPATPPPCRSSMRARKTVGRSPAIFRLQFAVRRVGSFRLAQHHHHLPGAIAFVNRDHVVRELSPKYPFQAGSHLSRVRPQRCPWNRRSGVATSLNCKARQRRDRLMASANARATASADSLILTLLSCCLAPLVPRSPSSRRRRLVAVAEDAAVEVPAHGAGKHHALQVAAPGDEILHLVAMARFAPHPAR